MTDSDISKFLQWHLTWPPASQSDFRATPESSAGADQTSHRPANGIQAESKRNPSGIQAESMASMELNGIKWNQMESNRTNRRQILKCRFSYGLVILVTHYRTVSWTEKNSDLP